jgi:hypothetical protein
MKQEDSQDSYQAARQSDRNQVVSGVDELHQIAQLASTVSGCKTAMIHLLNGGKLDMYAGRNWEPSFQHHELPFCKKVLASDQAIVVEDTSVEWDGADHVCQKDHGISSSWQDSLSGASAMPT